MSTEGLTRAQAKQAINRLSCFLTYPALDDLHALDDTDAIQRAEIERLKGEIDTLDQVLADHRTAWKEKIEAVEAKLATVTAEVQHWREAATSVGESDGHGWATTTQDLRAQLAALQQHADAVQAALGLTGVESRPLVCYVEDLKASMATLQDLRAEEQQRLTAQLAKAMKCVAGYEQLQQELARCQKAMEIYRNASYQSHSGHWDSQGTGGFNCPECIRANDLRDQAQQALKGGQG